MKRLEGKIALITGASEGIGFATARLFIEEGAHVFITGRRSKNLETAVQKLGRNVSGVVCDSGSLSDLDRLYNTIKKEKGRLDIVFVNAGLGFAVPFDSVTEEDFDTVFDVNAKGTFFTIQNALPFLQDGGAILMTGSIAGAKGVPSYSVYCASKAAIRSYARTLAIELKEKRIRVNVISPGVIKKGEVERNADGRHARIVASTPLGRQGEPEEVARAALFLASDDASFITGVELFVDGGAAQI